MTSMQYANNLYAKSCEVAEIFDKSTLNVIFMGKISFSISHIWRDYRSTGAFADGIDIVFKMQLLLAILKGFVKPASSGNHIAPSNPFPRRN